MAGGEEEEEEHEFTRGSVSLGRELAPLGTVMTVGDLRSSRTWGSGTGRTPPWPRRSACKWLSRLDISVGHRCLPGLTKWNKCSLNISWCERWSFGAQPGAGWRPLAEGAISIVCQRL